MSDIVSFFKELSLLGLQFHAFFLKNNFLKILRFFKNLEQLRTMESQLAGNLNNNVFFFNKDKDWAFKKVKNN